GRLRRAAERAREARLRSSVLLLSAARALRLLVLGLQPGVAAARSATRGIARRPRSDQATEEALSRREPLRGAGRGGSLCERRRAGRPLYRRPQVLLPRLEPGHLAVRSLDATLGLRLRARQHSGPARALPAVHDVVLQTCQCPDARAHCPG